MLHDIRVKDVIYHRFPKEYLHFEEIQNTQLSILENKTLLSYYLGLMLDNVQFIFYKIPKDFCKSNQEELKEVFFCLFSNFYKEEITEDMKSNMRSAIEKLCFSKNYHENTRYKSLSLIILIIGKICNIEDEFFLKTFLNNSNEKILSDFFQKIYFSDEIEENFFKEFGLTKKTIEHEFNNIFSTLKNISNGKEEMNINF